LNNSAKINCCDFVVDSSTINPSVANAKNVPILEPPNFAKPSVGNSLLDELASSHGSFGRFWQVLHEQPYVGSGPRTPSCKNHDYFRLCLCCLSNLATLIAPVQGLGDEAGRPVGNGQR